MVGFFVGSGFESTCYVFLEINRGSYRFLRVRS